MPRRAVSTAYRIAGFFSISFAVATILLGTAVYLVSHDALQNQLDERIESEMASLLRIYKAGGQSRLVEAVVAREEIRGARNLGYVVTDTSRRRLAGRLNTEIPPPGWSKIPFRDRPESDDYARALSVGLNQGGSLIVAADGEPIEQIDETMISLFAAAFGLMLLVGIAGSYILGSFIRGRLDQLNRAAEDIIEGDLGRRMPIRSGGDEFDRLSTTLNRMLDRIGTLMNNLRQVSSDIAHDLRTPLSHIHQQLETALVSPPGERDRAAVARAIASLDEVLKLFEATLRIAEVEGGALRRSFKDVDLSKLVAGVAEGFAPAVEDGGRSLSNAIKPNIVVKGDRDLLAQALANLIDNALLHTPAGTTVWVELARHNGGPTLSVVDNGLGVPDEERTRLLQRFTRLERSRSSRGHGLGLSLVAAIAATHDAELTLDDANPGLAVRLAFPITGGADR
ncbi:MAG: HAMP domain-containing protein [Sphingomonas bacterium]|nr:HAMP domain-containing protein [Sphingomonas bacterium]